MNTFDRTMIEAEARRKQLAHEAHVNRLLSVAPRRTITASRRLVAHFGEVLVRVGNRLKLPETTPKATFSQLELN